MSTVHRSTYLDYVGVKTFDSTGRVTGEKRFLGLFTSAVYNRSPREIPLLRHKIDSVVAHFGLDPASHDGKAVVHVLETYPRDELFQASVAELIRTVRGIVNLYERQRVRVFLRRDTFGRFYSALIFVPRDRYNTQVRQRIESVINAAAARDDDRIAGTAVGFGTGARAHDHPRAERQPAAVDADALEAADRGDRAHLERPAARRADRDARRARRPHRSPIGSRTPSRPHTKKTSPSRSRWKTSGSSAKSSPIPTASRCASRRIRRPSARRFTCACSARPRRSRCRRRCRSWRTWASWCSASIRIASPCPAAARSGCRISRCSGATAAR